MLTNPQTANNTDSRELLNIYNDNKTMHKIFYEIQVKKLADKIT